MKIKLTKKKQDAKTSNSCKWCLGTRDIHLFCEECKVIVQNVFDKELRLGPIILSKKYKTPCGGEISKDMVWTKLKKNMCCDCFSGIKCTCKQDANIRITTKYNCCGFEIVGHCFDRDPEYDGSGSICNVCLENKNQPQ